MKRYMVEMQSTNGYWAADLAFDCKVQAVARLVWLKRIYPQWQWRVRVQ